MEWPEEDVRSPETVRQEPLVDLEQPTSAQDVSFNAKYSAHPFKAGEEVNTEGREKL